MAETVSKVLLVTDSNSGDEAMYVDGSIVFEDCTVHACDIAEKTKGLVVEITHETVSLEDAHDIFPRDAKDLPPFQQQSAT